MRNCLKSIAAWFRSSGASNVNLHFKSAAEIAKLIRERKVSAVDALEHFLARIEKYNPRLNAIVWLDAAGRARTRPRSGRGARQGRSMGPAARRPHDDQGELQRRRLADHLGRPELKDNVTDDERGRGGAAEEGGRVLFGKTNVPLMLADNQSYNAIYGTTNNPWDVSRTPGGSSGGSAAAIAAGLTGIDAGSDIGSSIRSPAHFCGVFGLKSTWGVAPPRSGPAQLLFLFGSFGHRSAGTERRRPRNRVPGHGRARRDRRRPRGTVALPACGATSLKDFRVAVKLLRPELRGRDRICRQAPGPRRGACAPGREDQGSRTSDRHHASRTRCTSRSCAPRPRRG